MVTSDPIHVPLLPGRFCNNIPRPTPHNYLCHPDAVRVEDHYLDLHLSAYPKLKLEMMVIGKGICLLMPGRRVHIQFHLKLKCIAFPLQYSYQIWESAVDSQPNQRLQARMTILTLDQPLEQYV